MTSCLMGAVALVLSGAGHTAVSGWVNNDAVIHGCTTILGASQRNLLCEPHILHVLRHNEKMQGVSKYSTILAIHEPSMH